MTTDQSVDPGIKTTNRRRKVSALLAAGLVLGLGATATLAAWNDSEFASGTFSAGTFDLEGSTNGITWAQHDSGGAAATLSFTVNPANLAPGDVVYAPFAVRLAANNSTDASLTVSAVTSTGTVTNLTYTLVRTSSITCNAAAVSGGTVVIASGTALTSIGTPVGWTQTKGSPQSSAGATQFVCFAVTAGSGLQQGQTGTSTWQFTATSTT